MVKLVLLPGMDGTGDLFHPFVKSLPIDIETQIIRYPLDRALSYAELIRLTASSLSESEQFVLLGESFSAPVAIQLAVRSPAQVKGILICAGFARSPVRRWPSPLVDFLTPLMFRLPITNFAIKRFLLDQNTPKSIVDAVRSAIESVPPNVLSKRVSEVLACDVQKEASRIKVPMLYLRGLRDRLVGEGCVQEILDVKSDMEVVNIDGPHLLLQSNYSQAAKVVSS